MHSICGIGNSEADAEVLEHLTKYGKIQRVIEVSSTEAQFKDPAIVEYESGEAIEYIQDNLPCDRPTSNPDVIHHIQLLSELYTANSGSTQTYLSELKDVAKLSGADFEKVLLDELARIQAFTQPKRT